MIYVGVLGSQGRMGQAILGVLENHPSCNLSIAGTRENVEPLFEASDVVIDFTSPDALSNHLNLALIHKKPLVIGTTGLQTHHENLLTSTARKIPLIVASNMSVGISILSNFVEIAARLLDESYDIEISELHHRHKKDAPSGTSFMLGRSAAKGRGKLLEELTCPAQREGERIRGQIGFSVQRGGMVIGDHAIKFIGNEEMIEISHRAFSRTTYAKGALRAAEWITKQAPGLYTMKDILGL